MGLFCNGTWKSPCDGVGGTVKRLVAKESLKRPFENQILNAPDFYNCCKTNIQNIDFFLISAKEIEIQRKIPIPAHTIPGTRKYHHFTPLSQSIISYKITSFESEISLKFNLSEKKVYNWTPNTYVSFVNLNNWYIGFINNILDDQLEAEISILQEAKKNNYFWPTIDMQINVPFNKILCQVSAEMKNNFVSVKLGWTLANFKKYQESQV